MTTTADMTLVSTTRTNYFAFLATMPVADASKETFALDIEEMNAETEAMKAKNESLLAELLAWKTAYAELESSNTSLQSGSDALKTECEKLVYANNKLAEDNDGFYAVLADVRAERDEMDLRIEELEHVNRQLETVVVDLRSEKATLLAHASSTIAGLQTQNEELDFVNERQKAAIESTEHVTELLRKCKANLELLLEDVYQRNDGLLEENIRLTATVAEQQIKIDWHDMVLHNAFDVQKRIEKENERLVEDSAVMEIRISCLAARKLMRQEELKRSNGLVEKFQNEQKGFNILIKSLQDERDALEKKLKHHKGLIAFQARHLREYRKANPELAKLLSSPSTSTGSEQARLRVSSNRTEESTRRSTVTSDSAALVNKWLDNVDYSDVVEEA